MRYFAVRSGHPPILPRSTPLLRHRHRDRAAGRQCRARHPCRVLGQAPSVLATSSLPQGRLNPFGWIAHGSSSLRVISPHIEGRPGPARSGPIDPQAPEPPPGTILQASCLCRWRGRTALLDGVLSALCPRSIVRVGQDQRHVRIRHLAGEEAHRPVAGESLYKPDSGAMSSRRLLASLDRSATRNRPKRASSAATSAPPRARIDPTDRSLPVPGASPGSRSVPITLRHPAKDASERSAGYDNPAGRKLRHGTVAAIRLGALAPWIPATRPAGMPTDCEPLRRFCYTCLGRDQRYRLLGRVGEGIVWITLSSSVRSWR